MTTSAQAASTTEQMNTFNPGPVGIGVSTVNAETPDHSSNRNGFYLTLYGNNHFQQRRDTYSLRRYGHGQGRLELGSNAGIMLSAMTGVTWIGLDRGSGWSPHIGVEPANGTIALQSGTRRNTYYQWLPMVSAGVQYGAGPCRVLPLIRAGGAGGSLGHSGLQPRFGYAYGAGAYFNCLGRGDLAVEYTRATSAGVPLDFGCADLSMGFSSDRLRLGFRGELDRIGPAGDVNTHLERRAIFTVRAVIEGLQ